MTAPVLRAARRPPLTSDWTRQLGWLAGTALCLIALFHRDALGMAGIWWHDSTFSHCLLIPLILAWLVHQRLPELRQLTPVAWWPGLLWAAGGAFCWLVGDAAGVALARHLGLVVMLQGAVIALLGPNVSRGLAFPIFYALFLVPFGEELVPLLQTVTARMAMALLGMAGVPATLNGVFITTPTGYFEVAEACSGAKFLIAMAAYAALVCNICFKSWPRRIVFLSASLFIAVIANGVRAFGTIYIAHLTSIEFAAGFDHVVYGWIFFAIVIVLVMAAGWPLFDRAADEAFFDPARLRGEARLTAPAALAAPLLLAIAALPQLWSAAVAAAADPVPARLTLPQVRGWTRIPYHPIFPWMPHFAGADRQIIVRYRNGQGLEADLAIAVYARQTEGHELVGYGQGAVGPDSQWAWSAPAAAPAGAMGERIMAPGPLARDVVSFYSVGGVITGNAAQVKLQTLKVRLMGGDQRAVALLVSAEDLPGRPAQAAIRAFLSDLGPIAPFADRSAGRN